MYLVRNTFFSWDSLGGFLCLFCVYVGGDWTGAEDCDALEASTFSMGHIFKGIGVNDLVSVGETFLYDGDGTEAEGCDNPIGLCFCQEMWTPF